MALIGAATGAIPAILMFADSSILRLYWSVHWPGWVWALEHIAGLWLFPAFFIVGLLAILLFRRDLLMPAILALLIQAAVIQALKFAIGRVRPLHGGADAWLWSPFHVINDAFPSGHAAAAWAMAVILIFAFPRLRSVSIACALFLCWERLQVFAHFPSDLAAGGLWGAGIAYLTFRQWHHPPQPSARANPNVPDDATDVPARSGLQHHPPHHHGHYRLAHAFATPWPCLLTISIILPVMLLAVLGHRVSIPETEAQAEALVSQQYHAILGREADPAGRRDYSAMLRQGMPVIGLQRLILLSDECMGRIRRAPATTDLPVIPRFILQSAGITNPQAYFAANADGQHPSVRFELEQAMNTLEVRNSSAHSLEPPAPTPHQQPAPAHPERN